MPVNEIEKLQARITEIQKNFPRTVKVIAEDEVNRDKNKEIVQQDLSELEGIKKRLQELQNEINQAIQEKDKELENAPTFGEGIREIIADIRSLDPLSKACNRELTRTNRVIASMNKLGNFVEARRIKQEFREHVQKKPLQLTKEAPQKSLLGFNFSTLFASFRKSKEEAAAAVAQAAEDQYKAGGRFEL